MNKQIRSALALAVLAAFAMLAFSACDILSGVSVKDRITRFVTELNTSTRTSAYTHMSITATNYAASMAPTYWSALFPVGTYTVTGISDSVPTNASAIITGSGTAASFGTQVVYFNLTKTGNDYFIAKMMIGGSTVFQ